MKRTMPTYTRRAFALSLLLTPIACLGCGGGADSVSTNGGEKRRQRVEGLEKKADLNRAKSGKNQAPGL